MASFSETVTCVYKAEITWGLCQSLLRFNGYEIAYADETEICGTRGVNQVKIWLRISPTTVEVSCKGMLESWCKKKVEEFSEVLKREIASYTPQREQQYLKVTREHMPTLGYVLPEKISTPLLPGKAMPAYPFAAGLAYVAIAVGLFYALWSDTENWSMAVLVGSIVGLGFTIRQTAIWAHYYNWKVLRLLLVACSLVLGGSTFYITWGHGFFEHKTTGLYLTMLFFFFVVPSIGGLGVLREGRLKVQKAAIPTDVLMLARFLSLQHHAEVGIRSELSKRGWYSEEDQNKVFDALESYYDEQQLQKQNAEKQ